MTVRLLLDEHVGRVFERLLRDRGYEVIQAKDEFGERTNDRELLQWCGDSDTVLVSNNVRDFEALDEEVEHAGLLLFFDQQLPENDPEGLARTVATVLEQYGEEEMVDERIYLGDWYDWLHE